jgi:carbonic anhydrase
MKKVVFIIVIAILSVSIISCNEADQDSGQTNEEQAVNVEKVSQVMSKEMQDELTPDAILEDLMKGNERYVSGEMIHRDLPAQVSSTTDGQFPKAVILACIDSRVPVEYIFDQGIGDIFVVRVAGNIENEELLGSIEYGLGVAGSKLFMVLGHENCGAVKSAIDQVDVGSANVTALLNEIEPAVLGVDEERNSADKEYFDKVIKENVMHTLEDIRKRSDIITNLENEGKIKLVSAYYNLTDGKVTLLSDEDHEGHSH